MNERVGAKKRNDTDCEKHELTNPVKYSIRKNSNLGLLWNKRFWDFSVKWSKNFKFIKYMCHFRHRTCRIFCPCFPTKRKKFKNPPEVRWDRWFGSGTLRSLNLSIVLILTIFLLYHMLIFSYSVCLLYSQEMKIKIVIRVIILS